MSGQIQLMQLVINCKPLASVACTWECLLVCDCPSSVLHLTNHSHQLSAHSGLVFLKLDLLVCCSCKCGYWPCMETLNDTKLS